MALALTVSTRTDYAITDPVLLAAFDRALARMRRAPVPADMTEIVVRTLLIQARRVGLDLEGWQQDLTPVGGVLLAAVGSARAASDSAPKQAVPIRARLWPEESDTVVLQRITPYRPVPDCPQTAPHVIVLVLGARADYTITDAPALLAAARALALDHNLDVPADVPAAVRTLVEHTGRADLADLTERCSDFGLAPGSRSLLAATRFTTTGAAAISEIGGTDGALPELAWPDDDATVVLEVSNPDGNQAVKSPRPAP